MQVCVRRGGDSTPTSKTGHQAAWEQSTALSQAGSSAQRAVVAVRPREVRALPELPGLILHRVLGAALQILPMGSLGPPCV